MSNVLPPIPAHFEHPNLSCFLALQHADLVTIGLRTSNGISFLSTLTTHEPATTVVSIIDVTPGFPQEPIYQMAFLGEDSREVAAEALAKMALITLGTFESL